MEDLFEILFDALTEIIPASLLVVLVVLIMGGLLIFWLASKNLL